MDTCQACGHDFHGLHCRHVEVVRTGVGLTQRRCTCTGPWASQ